jgi:hypothetical protein
MASSGVSGGGSRTSSLASGCLQRQGKRLRRRVSLHRVCALTLIVTISMHATNLDAHLPFLQVVCMPESYDDEKDPCLWKRQEAWDPHPFAEDQEPPDLVGQAQERWWMERPVSSTTQKINTGSRKVSE